MTAGTPTAVPYPAFLQGNAGRLFTLHFKPDAPDRGAILCVPPFGEEMNRTRALMAAQARAFAGMGYGCLLLDLFGTGDSGGDLPDATWEIWRSDVENAARWLADHSEGPISLWGIRLGCLLAAEVAAMHPDMFERLLFWQPVADGKTYLTQTLRLRVSALVDRNEPPETTAEMRERLAGGALLEVSGYVLPGALTEALDRTRLVDLKRLAGQRVDWLECVADAERPLLGGASKTLEQLTASGVEVQAHAVVAPQLWTLHKQAKADGLLHATSALFSERAGDER